MITKLAVSKAMKETCDGWWHFSNASTSSRFQAVVIAKLTYASQSWSGFISVADTQRLNAFLHRSIR